MNVVPSTLPATADIELETPSAETVETLRMILSSIFVPAGLQPPKPEDYHAVKEFTCQLPISKGLDSLSLRFLHRIGASQFVVGEATTTVSWPMLFKQWTDLCTARNRPHLVEALPLLLEQCFERSPIRVIGLVEMQWEADNRQIVLRSHQPNYNRMVEFLKQSLNLESNAEVPHPATSTA